MKTKNILHVSESFGGGVTTAIIEYAKNSKQFKHYLLATVRNEAKIELGDDNPFEEIYILPLNPVLAIRCIRKKYIALVPRYVHLHSSYAGLYGRLSFINREQIIYTPHCYGFERLDLNLLKRGFIYLAEQLLSMGGYCVAGVSPREVQLGKSMIGTRRALYLPNYAECDLKKDESIKYNKNTERQFTIGMVGRLSPQKDPVFFVNVYKSLSRQNKGIRFLWLGGGSIDQEDYLMSNGIEVTGWLPHIALLHEMQKLDGYLHTARWEGNPMSILEAASINLPIILRDIPSIRSLGELQLCENTEDAVDKILALYETSSDIEHYHNTFEIQKNFTRDSQIKALLDLYS
ncbi:MAG: glycosyltransferase [Candidatus Thiodiazotropha sp.]